MKPLIQNAILVLALLNTSQATFADDLFSEVTITSVFGESAKSNNDEQPQKSSVRRITGASSLQKMLKEAGLTTQEISSSSVAVALDAPQTKDKILNAVIVVHIDDGLLNIGVPLVRIDEKKVPASKLLEMMNQGRNNDAIYFVYSPESKWFGARRGLSNQNMSSERLVAELNEIVDFAQNSVELWQPLGDTLKTVETNEGTVDPDANTNSKPETSPKPQSNPNPTPTPPTTETSISLQGTWAAAGPNGQGFGIKFDDKTFELVIVNNGKSSQSKGTWSLDESQLKLVGDGMTITGTVTSTSATQFELTLPNQKPLKFNKS